MNAPQIFRVPADPELIVTLDPAERVSARSDSLAREALAGAVRRYADLERDGRNL